MSTTLSIPPATESDWQWREYKAYVAMCGDYSECSVLTGKAVVITPIKPSVYAVATKLSAIIGKLKQPECELEAVGEGLG